MTKLHHITRRVISIACCSVFLLSAVALALTLKNGNQSTQGPEGKEKDETVKLVEGSPDQPLRILGNDDCPLRLVKATVKEVPGSLFTKLTGKTTGLATVSSVPEATLVNTSGQTVTRFFLAVRDPKSRTTRGILQGEIAIKPGESYNISREHFDEPEKVTAVDKDGAIRHRLIAKGMDSEKKWLPFAARSDLFITIVKVEFENGDDWVIKEGGEVN